MSKNKPEEDPIAEGMCRFAESAAAYVRGELSESETLSFETHRQGCAECRRMESGFRQVLARLVERPAAIVGRDLTDDIMRRISAETSVRRLFFRPVLLGVAATVLMAIGTAVFLGRILGPASVPPTAAVKAMPDVAALANMAPRNEAIRAAIEWLASVQESSGAWDPVKWGGKKDYEVSLTSMALLAILRGDRKSGSSPALSTVKTAADFLLSRQNADGSFGPECTGRMYNHGITAVALLGLPGHRDDPVLRAAIEQALAFIREQQHESGGWGYEKNPGSQANTSISVWQMEALMLARQSGWKELGGSLNRGLNWLRGMVDEQGAFGYQAARDGRTEDHTLTAMGARCLFVADSQLAHPASVNARIRGALRQMAVDLGQGQDFYRSYFLASALNAGSTEEYGVLLANLQNLIIRERCPPSENSGSWDPVGRWSNIGGRLYATTMATLSLEEGSSHGPAL